MDEMERYDIGTEVVHPKLTRGFTPGSRGVVVDRYLSGCSVRWDSGPLAGKTMDMSNWEIERSSP
jgi:hypothetical protein